MREYKPQLLDKKWQQQWTTSRAFEVEADPQRPKFYCLEMLPYPSGDIHVGHVTMAVPSPHLGGMMLGLAQVRKESATIGTGLRAVLEDGRDIHATVVPTPVYDPERVRLRS